MKNKRNIITGIAMFLLTIVAGCKDSFLDVKPDQSLLVPTTLDDFRGLLDNSNTIMNYAPALQVLAADDYTVADNGFAGTTLRDGKAYLWADDLYEGSGTQDWNRSYQQAFYSNVVLDGLEDFDVIPSNQTNYNEIKGTALFLRAFAFYQIAQQFAPVYDSKTANNELGIPIRLTADVNIKSERASLQESYNQILSDLKQSLNLLPSQVGYKTRPTKASCLGMIARVYQTMEDYPNALLFAQQALAINSQLIDYSTLVATDPYPLPATLPSGNVEVLFYSILNTATTLLSTSTVTTINSTLYNSYMANDLRKTMFFTPRGAGYGFKGSYAKSTSIFAGIATNELYLIAAESCARADQKDLALQYLNQLLINRWKKNSYVPFVANNAEEALKIILTERRKELIGRETRWSDLRRLNKDARFAVTITKIYNGQTYVLLPQSKRYTFPIPDDIIALTGITQNPR